MKGILQYTGGKTLTATRKKGKYVYYHTNDWSFRVTQREIFEKLEKIVAQWIIPEDILPMVRDYIENQLFSEQKAINEEKNRYEKKMQDLVVQEFNLTSIFSKGKISEEMFDLQKQEIFAEKDKIQEKINKLSAFEAADYFKFEKIIELVSNLLPAYKNGDEYTKGLIVRAGFIELLIDDEKSLKIKEKEPFYWLSLLNVQGGRGSWT